MLISYPSGVGLSFNNLLNEQLIDGKFGAAPYRLRYRERVYSSLAALEADGKLERVATGGSAVYRYDGPLSKRYVLAEGISYDFLVTLYSGNDRRALVLRPFEYSKGLTEALERAAGARGKQNLEARVIGLQNGQDTQCLNRLADWLIDRRIAISEVDLFGSETRHIAFDLKLGTTYSVLGENRHYSSEELRTKITLEEFRARLAPGPSAKGGGGEGKVGR